MSEKQMSLMEKLFQAEALLHRYQRLYRNRERQNRGGDLHRGQGRVLLLLKMQPEISQRELSYLLAMRPQSLGEILAKLEANGYITRTPSEADRRVMDIHLTEEGQRAAVQVADDRQDSSKLLEIYSEEEQAALGEYLDRLIAALDIWLEENAPEEGPDRQWEGRRGGRPPYGYGPQGPHGPHAPREGGRHHPGFDRDVREKMDMMRAFAREWQGRAEDSQEE